MAPIFAFKMATKMAAEISNYAQICQFMVKKICRWAIISNWFDKKNDRRHFLGTWRQANYHLSLYCAPNRFQNDRKMAANVSIYAQICQYMVKSLQVKAKKKLRQFWKWSWAPYWIEKVSLYFSDYQRISFPYYNNKPSSIRFLSFIDNSIQWQPSFRPFWTLIFSSHYGLNERKVVFMFLRIAVILFFYRKWYAISSHL